ncbi:hypothetical protein SAMN02746019_00013490 [Thermoflexus hugenholtzii JAD2]|uniref:Uncharacterized protein n=1 Tax=Thermoflexus hugenholtzii JAD2 TaxID=877466 RepID=A0A212R604_9CHLR|nr:hypothetical protein SAMN02746019_00013490 [Thermoflexus hugenholtzii JAD2]
MREEKDLLVIWRRIPERWRDLAWSFLEFLAEHSAGASAPGSPSLSTAIRQEKWRALQKAVEPVIPSLEEYLQEKQTEIAREESP